MPRTLRLPHVGPAAYRRITVVALALLVFIVVTGAAVRLSGSGLGCTDWPNCTDKRLVAELETHQLIEFVNRAITGVVSVVVAVAVLGSLRRTPRRRDLTWLSLGLVAGVVGQIVLGGLVVLTHLNPWFVQGHFVVSMLLVLDAAVLAHRAGQPDGPRRPRVEPDVLRLGRIVVGLAVLVILSGTVVTGSGPHSGHVASTVRTTAEAVRAADAPKRLPIAVHDAARIHGTLLILLLGAIVLLVVRLQRLDPDSPVRAAGRALLFVCVLQGAIGYTQYFTGVPPILVGLHVFGATLLWLAVVHLLLQMSVPVESTVAHTRESLHVDGVADGPAGRDLVPQ
ncbi:MAG: cytochrome oxidase assembly [Acidimicrobiales bacterium]|nr:cytochrome oxidase assembly [Acidimicrobiales bacterium]